MDISKIPTAIKSAVRKTAILCIIIALSIPVNVPQVSGGGGTSPIAVLFGATGAGSPARLYSIDPTDGSTNLIGSVGFLLSGIAFSPNGTLFGAQDAFIRINPATGAGTLIGFPGPRCADISFAPDGTLYCISPRPSALYTINQSTGAGTLVGRAGTSDSALGSAMDVSPTGIILFGNSDGLYTLNSTTGNATLVAFWTFTDVLTGQSFCRPSAFDFDPSGRLFASFNCAGGTFLVTVDTGTATVAPVGQTVNALDAIAFGATALPLAGTILDACTREPIEGATVTLLKESPPGSSTFVISLPSDHIPLTHPQITGADGIYGWNVVPNTYKIRAEKAGYVTNEGPKLAIPPAATGVNVSIFPIGGCTPTIAPIPNKTVDELTTLTFPVNATDPDIPAQSLTFNLSGAPEGAAIDPATGLFTWTPTEAQGPDNFTFEVHVTDGFSEVFTTVYITVVDVETTLNKAKTTGHGYLKMGGVFDFDVKSSDGVKVKGNLEYQDKIVLGIKLDSREITSFSVDDTVTKARFGGVASINKVPGFTFEVYVEDNGKHAREDFFSIRILDPAGSPFYTKEGNLTKGKIEVKILK